MYMSILNKDNGGVMDVGDTVKIKETASIRNSAFADYAGRTGEVIGRTGRWIRVVYGEPKTTLGDYIDVGEWRLELVSRTSL